MDVLANLKREHPRLLLDAEGFQRIRKLTEANPHARRWRESLRAVADQALGEPPFQYKIINGKSLELHKPLADRVQALLLAFKLDGNTACRDRIWRELEAIAGFPDWNPTHFLTTAGFTLTFALAYDWLHADLTPEQRRICREAIVLKGLKPGLEVYRSGQGWPLRESNWNQVCNGGLVLGALALADEEPEIAREILESAIRSLPLAAGQYAPDGAGVEGVTYWGFGAEFNVLLLAGLDSALGDDFGLSRIPGFAESGDYQLYMSGADRTAFDFSDCKLRRVSEPIHYWMAHKFGKAHYSWFRSSEVERPGGEGTFLDLLWYDDSGRAFDPRTLPLDKHFRGAQCASQRSAWNDPQALVLAIQGGDNPGRSVSRHRHLDLGSFILEAQGERWAMDSGLEKQSYLKLVHGNDPLMYYRLRAEGHNTLVLNPDAGPDQALDASARIRSFESRPEGASAVVDLSSAYARYARQVERRFALVEKRTAALIRDLLVADKPVDLWWFMHTSAEISLSPDARGAILIQNGKRLRAEITAPVTARFEIREAAPFPTSPHPEKQTSNEGRRKLAIHLPGTRELDLKVVLRPDK